MTRYRVLYQPGSLCPYTVQVRCMLFFWRNVHWFQREDEAIDLVNRLVEKGQVVYER